MKAATEDELHGDWLDKALAGDSGDPLAPVPLTMPSNAVHPLQPVQPPLPPQPAVMEMEEADNALAHEVEREMSYAKSAAVKTIAAEPSTIAASPPAPLSDVIGRHQAAGVEYIMYADGSIDADDGKGLVRFKSMAELKAHITPEA